MEKLTVHPARRSYLSWKWLDGKIVVVDEHEGAVYHLNDVGSVIWEMLDGDRSVEQILLEVSDHFPENPKKIQKDTLDFLNHLDEMDLIGVNE